MRDYGKVHTSFWSSGNVRALSEDGRTLAIYLLTCPHGTISGVFRLPDGYACEDLQWGSERVQEGFAELFRNGFATRCKATKWFTKRICHDALSLEKASFYKLPCFLKTTGYNRPVTSKKGVIGIENPVGAAKSRCDLGSGFLTSERPVFGRPFEEAARRLSGAPSGSQPRFGRPPHLRTGSAVHNRNWSNTMTHTLALGTSSIRELDGLYSLNDLHKASGENPNHRPGEYIRLEQTKALIAEIQNAGIPAFKTQRGANGGTYACRELVIAYAAWISAAFHLKVIRVFLAQQEQPSPVGLKDAIAQAVREEVSRALPPPKKAISATPEELITAWFEPNGCLFASDDFLARLAQACIARLLRSAEYQKSKANGKTMPLVWATPIAENLIDPFSKDQKPAPKTTTERVREHRARKKALAHVT